MSKNNIHIEDIIKKYLEQYILENIDIDVLYTTKFFKSDHVTILNIERDLKNNRMFINLSDGSRLDYYIFENSYEECVKFFTEKISFKHESTMNNIDGEIDNLPF